MRREQIIFNHSHNENNIDHGLLDLFFQQSTDAIMIYSLDLTFVKVNQKGAEMFGSCPSEMMGKKNLGLIGNYASVLDSCIQKALDTQKPVSVVHEINISGNKQFYECMYTPMLDETGNVVAISAVCRNVNEREIEPSSLKKLLSDEYLQSIKRLQNLVFKLKKKDTGDIIFLFSEGIIANVLRINTEHVFGKTANEVFQFDVSRILDENFRKAFLGKVVFFQLEYSGLIFNTTLSPILKDGQVVEVFGTITDVTKHKNVEKKLKESEERYQLLVELFPESITVQSEGKILYINPAGVKLLGAKDQKELIGTSVFRYLHPDCYDRMQYAEQKIADTGFVEVIEEKLLRLDGQAIDVETTKISIIYMGKPAMLSITRDVSERKRGEEALHVARQELLDTVEQQLGMTFKFKQVNGRFIHTLCNGGLLSKMNMIPEQVVGKELYDFLPFDAANEKLKYYQRAWQGEENLTYEGEKNGTIYLNQLRPIKRNGEVVEVICSCVDITERKRAEKALQDSEAKYRLIADHMSDLIAVLDVNGVVKYASPSHEMVLGFPSHSYEGKSAFTMVHPKDIADVQASFVEMLRTKKSSLVEFRYKHAKKEWISVEVNRTPVLNQQGEVESVVVVGRDVTEQRKTEELLRRSEKLAIVGELAAGVAHEVRNPLTTIKGFLQFMHPKIEDKRFFDIMLSELDRIETIINEFLILSKPQTSECTKNDINSILNDILTLLEPEMLLKNIQVSIDLESGIPLVYCEKNQIKQVFINIIKNAMEAMPSGGALNIRMNLLDANELLIRFQDEGCGVPVERLSKLGEPFYTMKEKGTGLGLMVCFKIIENHQGKIHIDSKEGEGTTVELILPIDRP